MNRTPCYHEQGSYFPCLMSLWPYIYPEDWRELSKAQRGQTICAYVRINGALTLRCLSNPGVDK